MLIMSDQTDPFCRHSQLDIHLEVLHQAVGVLMDWYDVRPPQATAQLHAWAVQCDASICEVAEALVNGICLGRSSSCRLTVVRQLERLLRELPIALLQDQRS
jgi:hypothetical protein